MDRKDPRAPPAREGGDLQPPLNFLDRMGFSVTREVPYYFRNVKSDMREPLASEL